MTKKGEVRLCRLCGKLVKGDARKVFCSEKCRIKARNKKQRAYQQAWYKEARDKEARTERPYKVQCVICKEWYKTLGGHVKSMHGLTINQYRDKYFD